LPTFCLTLDGYTTEDLVFLWKAGDPVQITKALHLPRFTLVKYLTDYCTSKTNTGKRNKVAFKAYRV
jgi:putative glutamate-gated chloride channel (fragment)